MIIRKAEIKDKEAILEMTKATWDDGDYIQHIFDKWLKAPGEFTVLEDNDEIVGCTKLSIIKPRNLWLEGIRVDPSKRRMGYAKILADYQLDLCQKLGFDHLNLSTWYQNESVKMLEKYPFEIIQKYKVLTYDKVVNTEFVYREDLVYEEVLAYFKTYFTGAFYACDWTFFSLDERMIRTFFDRGEIYKLEEDYVIVSDIYSKDNSLCLVFMDQVNDQLMDLLAYLKSQKQVDYLMTMTSLDRVDDLKSKGFEGYDEEALDVYLYEYQK